MYKFDFRDLKKVIITIYEMDVGQDGGLELPPLDSVNEKSQGNK
jgi:hypothetical protein